jgi:uncharacterized membrane protein YphA (DoxX/SURF4 family)
MTNATVTRSPITRDAAKSGRKTNLTLWVLQALAVVTFVGAGLVKVTGDAGAVESFNEMGLGDLGRYAVGSLELAGAVALLIPRLCGLAALAFTALMIGATITQLLFFEPVTVVTPVVVLVLMAVIAWGRRDRTAALLALVTRG